MKATNRTAIAILAALALAAGVTTAAPGAEAARRPNTAKRLERRVKVRRIERHLDAFQAIANANGGTRAAGTDGYDISVLYVVNQLERAGYSPELHEFEFDSFEELSPSELSIVTPNPVAFVNPDDVRTMSFSGAGDVEAALVAVDTDGPDSGCEAEDFTEPLNGAIAVLKRGACTFQLKADNAFAAGAAAVVIFNDGATPDREGPIAGRLGGPAEIPVVGPSLAAGNQLVAAAAAGGTGRVVTDTVNEVKMSVNVIADTAFGDPDNVVVLGAHLDSVAAGPGINDNGTGSATILEIAKQLRRSKNYKNQVRFAFWGAEEAGLLGSTAYVESLSEEQLDQIALNLNFDMMGSPNFARFVYDGNGSDGGPAGPLGSGAIEQTFLDYFDRKGLPTAPTEFSGRSDYGPFIAAGIPAGGLFTGAEGVKTAEEAELFGGDADVAYDICYHEACDTRENVNRRGLRQMSKAAAYVTGAFADSTLVVNGVLRQLEEERSSTVQTVEFDRVGELWIK